MRGKLLHSDMLLPSTSTPPLASRSVQKYLARGIDYFYSAIAATAYRSYLKCLYEKARAGVTREATYDSGTRFTIKISKAAAAKLCVDCELIHDSESLNAIKDATVAVFKRFRGGDRIIVALSTPEGKPGLRCLLRHLAVVFTRIEKSLKRPTNVTSPATPGVNPGHREPWRAMLNVWHGALTQKGEIRNGLRLVDGDRTVRGFAPVDQVGDNGARDVASEDAVGSTSAAAAGAAPLAARLEANGMAVETTMASEVARSGAGGIAGASGNAPAGAPSIQGGTEVVGGTTFTAGGPTLGGVPPEEGSASFGGTSSVRAGTASFGRPSAVNELPPACAVTTGWLEQVGGPWPASALLPVDDSMAVVDRKVASR